MLYGWNFYSWNRVYVGGGCLKIKIKNEKIRRNGRFFISKFHLLRNGGARMTRILDPSGGWVNETI